MLSEEISTNLKLDVGEDAEKMQSGRIEYLELSFEGQKHLRNDNLYQDIQ